MFDTMRKYLWVIKAISRLDLSTQKKVLSHFLTAQKKYIPKKKKADVEDILKCALCPNMCRFDCPVLQATKSETYSPAGKSRIAYLLEMGRFSSDDAINLMYACAGCSACQEWCPFHFSVEDLLVGVRKDLIDQNVVPSPLLEFQQHLVKNHTVYEHGSTSLGLDSKRADVLYFAGCTALNERREVAQATLNVLEEAGIEFCVLEEEWCCGAPLSLLGFEKDFKRAANHNTTAINEGGYTTLVCSCPECVRTFRDVYPKIGFNLKMKILHSSQFLLKLLKEGKITFKEHNKEYIYHDPCVLSRKLDIHEEPRELLQSIPGVTLKEAQFNRKETRCCGMGGLLRVTSPEISLKVTMNRASELGESQIVTACPSCKVAFNRVKDIDVSDLSEVILKAL